VEEHRSAKAYIQSKNYFPDTKARQYGSKLSSNYVTTNNVSIIPTTSPHPIPPY